MNEERIKEAFSDEEFVKSLMDLETPEEVQNALAEKDIDLSIQEIYQIAAMLQEKAYGELTEEDLENVVGGASNIAAEYAEVVTVTISHVKKFIRRW